jgi:hypothetical protein
MKTESRLSAKLRKQDAREGGLETPYNGDDRKNRLVRGKRSNDETLRTGASAFAIIPPVSIRKIRGV